MKGRVFRNWPVAHTDAASNSREFVINGTMPRSLAVLLSKRCLLAAMALGCTLAMAESPHLDIPKITRAPKLEDFAGMEPTAEIAAQMVKVEGLLERTPSDGALVSERTVVYLGYDAKDIYAVFVCFDRTPEQIRARLVNRDKLPDDEDSIALQIDTFHDRKHAYGFQVNPLGVQQDGIWTEGKTWDLSFDTVWHTEGKLTPQGYVVLIAVPFKSLRFSPGDSQLWGVLLYRGIPRRNEEAFWPGYSTKIAGRLLQAGEIRGLEHIAPGRNFQFVPYGSLLASRSIDERDPSAAHFTGETAKANVGLDSKFIIKNGLVLDTTVHPDFSQVESDEPQQTVNQRFEVFFPEKRPFFIENASYFDTPINLLFTRRIADPKFGARLTGKAGHYAIGALVADDKSPGEVVPVSSPLNGGRALFEIFRVNRDIGKESTIGAIYAARTFQGNSNFVGGVDGRFRLNRTWITDFQGVASSTDVVGVGHFAGPAYEASLQGTGRKATYKVQFDDRSPGFQTDTGFVNRVDLRQVTHTLTYRFRPEGKRLISWGPDFNTTNIWDHRSQWLEQTYSPSMNVEFGRQTNVTWVNKFRREQLRPQDFSVLFRNASFQENVSGISLGSSFVPRATFSAWYLLGNGVNFLPPAGVAPASVRSLSANVTSTLSPTHALTIANTYLLTRLTDPRSGAAVFNNHILRSKWNYQFTRSLALRTIIEYDAVQANQSLTSLQTRKRINGDVLLSYVPHPGTAIYLGYNSNLENIDPALAQTPDGLRRTPNAFINNGRQLFAKVSYLFRF